MVKKEKVDSFLKLLKAIAEQNPDYDFLSDNGISGIYRALRSLGIKSKDKGFNLREKGTSKEEGKSIFENLESLFINNKSVHIQSEKNFCHFTSANIEMGELLTEIKIYVPLDAEHIEEGAKQILQFLIDEKISHESKIASTIRFDDFVIRVVDPKEAEKVFSFIENNSYIQEGLIEANPFALHHDRVAVVSDGCASYNYILSMLIAHYITNRKNNLEQVNCDDFYNYIQGEYNKEFIDFNDDNDIETIRKRFKCSYADIQQITLLLLKNKEECSYDEYLQIYKDFAGYPEDMNQILKELFDSKNSYEEAFNTLKSYLLSKKTPKDLRRFFPSPCIKFVIWKNLIDRQITLGDYLLENGISLDSIQK